MIKLLMFKVAMSRKYEQQQSYQATKEQLEKEAERRIEKIERYVK